MVSCPGQAPTTPDLAHTPPSGQPASFVFTATADDRVHELDGLGCNYDWTIEGDVARLGSVQRQRPRQRAQGDALASRAAEAQSVYTARP